MDTVTHMAPEERTIIESAEVCEGDPSPEAKLAAAEKLERHFAEVAAQQEPCSAEEFEAVLAEAIHWAKAAPQPD